MIFDKYVLSFIDILKNKIIEQNKNSEEKYSENIKILKGKKYYKIYIGDSGKFLLSVDTGNLYFITGYGTADLEKNFGFLPDIIKKGFDWDGYSIIPVGGKKSVNGYGGPISQPNRVNNG